MSLKSSIYIILVFLTLTGRAQKAEYLVLIDAETPQLFYARIGDKMIASSAAGHVIIPHLSDSSYALVIGFPHAGYPEQRFSLHVSGRDLGLQLRNLGSKGWALYNWQTSELTLSENNKNDSSGWGPGKGVKRDDPFSRLMASVVNDSTVLYNTYIPEPVQKDSSVKPNEVIPDSATQILAKTALPDSVTAQVKTDSVKPSPLPRKTRKELAAERADSVKLAARKRKELREKPVVIAADSATQALPGGLVADSSKSPATVHADSVKIQPRRTRKQIQAARADSIRLATARLDSASADSLGRLKLANHNPVPAKTDSLQAEPPIKKAAGKYPFTKKISEKTLKTTVKMVFVDAGKNGSLDTIIVFVPFEIAVIPKPLPGDTVYSKQSKAKDSLATVVKTDTVAKQGQKNSKPGAAELKEGSTAEKKNRRKGISLPDCKKAAGDYEVGVLRVDLLTANAINDKLAAAKKYFREECFTVDQIRLLGELFATDQFRFQFYEAAYPYISDRENFPQLATQLTEAPVIKKFRAIGQ